MPALARAAALLLVVTVVTTEAWVQVPQKPTVSPLVRRPRERAKVIRTYPHDASAFTQGLTVADGWLYESTGLYGQSRVRKVELETGKVIAERRLEDEDFGEGLTVLGRSLIQLTWLRGVGFVYDHDTLQLERRFNYGFEGWGLTLVGSHLVASDGGPAGRLRLLDAATFAPAGEVRVTDQGQPVGGLNELEWVEGELYANVWRTDLVCRIDLATGRVLGWVDLSNLLTTDERRRADVLNGIAYDPTSRRLFVTGKLWPKLFEIEIASIE
jgi:glutamine cyclotransferase